MSSKTKLFSDLMRQLEIDIGSRDLTELVLLSLIDAIRAFKGTKFDDFCKQYSEFAEMVKNTEPKFGIFRYYFGYLEKEMYEKKEWKKHAIKRIEQTLKYARKQKKLLLNNADKIKVENKTILIHDHSHTVQDVLVHYKNKKIKFNVIIAEQDYKKTHDNIERLHSAGIPFTVVPAYMLSHLHDQIDMIFYGALTLKDTQHFVMNPGALSIITEFQLDETPIYMFLGTDKFSLWKSKKRGEIFIHKHKRTHIHKPIEYERIKYSHDRVPAKFFKKIITNEGIFDHKELEKVFKNAYEQYN
jgi:translation initiation factor 2B subunit (eIF-2B alpha/beta/delta family)